MSTRYNNGSHYENHQRAAELHDIAAHAHRSAANAHEKQDHQSGQELSKQAYDHTGQTHRNAVNEHGIAIFTHHDTAVLAHELWQARGCPEGSPDEDWFQASQDLRARAEVQER